jgi:hypothetical protein
MNTKRFIISSILVFIFVFAFDFVVHGILLKDAYGQTAHLWRPEAEMKMPFMVMSQVSFSLVIAFLFTRNYEGKGIGEGLRFGLLIGLLIGALQLGTYCYMPIPLCLTLFWVAAETVRGLGAGIVLALSYKN